MELLLVWKKIPSCLALYFVTFIEKQHIFGIRIWNILNR